MLNIPASTLRFWERKGLLNIRKQENHYRCFSDRDVLDIADIAFFRNLGIPVKNVKHAIMHPIESYCSDLELIQEQLIQEKKDIEYRYWRISEQIRLLDRINELRKKDYEILDDLPFTGIVKFSCRNEDQLRQYLNDTTQYVWHVHTHEQSEGRRCILADPKTTDQPLVWSKTPGWRYAHFLVRCKVDDDYKMDFDQTLSQFSSHYETGNALLQALTFAVENGQHYWYMEAYVEVAPLSEPAPSAPADSSASRSFNDELISLYHPLPENGQT